MSGPPGTAPARARWPAALGRLLLVVAGGAVGWGLLVQLKVGWTGEPGSLGPVLPLLVGAAAAKFVRRAAGGWAVGLLLPPAVGLAVLLGCVWGYRSFLAAHGLDWGAAAILRNYFRFQLRHAPTWDRLDVAAAAAGAVVGMMWSRDRKGERGT